MSERTRIGYLRVSTDDQSLESQRHALLAAGVSPGLMFEEHVSGRRSVADRPELERALATLRPGSDALVVYSLSRLGRSVRHLLDLTTWLRENDIEFVSLSEGMDTSTPSGRMLFTVMAAISEFEADLIRERTLMGLQAARANGTTLGRPIKLTPEKLSTARLMLADGARVVDAAAVLGVSSNTLYRHLRLTDAEAGAA